MGVAGATLAPSTLSLIFNMFRDPGQRAAAIGVWISSFSAGSAIGPHAGRGTAGAFLVGLGVPAGPAGDGAAARARAPAAPRVPQSRRGASGPAQRRDVAGGRVGGDLRPQADRPGRLRHAAGRRHPGGAGRRRPLRAPAAGAGRPPDRAAPVPATRLQRVAGHELPRHLRGRRVLPLHRAVPAARARALALAGGPLVAALGRRVHRRVQPGAALRAPLSPRLRAGGRAWRWRPSGWRRLRRSEKRMGSPSSWLHRWSSRWLCRRCSR